MTHPIRVLLVDDHALLRQGLRKMLDDAGGVEVVGESDTAQHGLELAEQLAPDVVVMDVDLPDMSGIDAAARLLGKSDNPAPAQTSHDVPKVIGLSCHTDPRVAERMLAAGASAYLPKKMAFAELASVVREVVNGKAVPSSSDRASGSKPTGGFAPHRAGAIAKGTIPVPPAATLTVREREVLRHMADGHSTKEIARLLIVSVKTVETHRRNLMEKLDLPSVAELTKYALREGLSQLNN
ncbi:MAG TPA: response regulator transcription factor [Tepidisphaeraceae bacterium]|jgi:DNA-binding NarL/FixJ family response regulator